MTMVYGDGQYGRTGRPFPQHLGVEVLGPDGERLEGVRVEWSVLEGDAELEAGATRTSHLGRTRIRLWGGSSLGEVLVEARLADAPQRSVRFQNTVSAYLVVMKADTYRNTTYTSDLRASVGDTIEWVHKDMQDTGVREHSATAYRTPEGGEGFDSGMMGFNDRFRWVPQTEGTWNYHCKKHDQHEVMEGTIHVSAAQ